MSYQPPQLPKLPHKPTTSYWFDSLPGRVALPLPWRFESPKPPYSAPNPSIVFPVSMGAYLSGCILLWHWFYNSILKFLGYDWATWSQRTTKLIVPRSRFIALRDEFKREPPPSHWKRKKTQPMSRRYERALFATLCAILTSKQTFALKTDLDFQQHLRSYRTSIGDLKTTELKPHDLTVLHRLGWVFLPLFLQIPVNSWIFLPILEELGLNA